MDDIKFTVVGNTALRFKMPHESADFALTYVKKLETLSETPEEKELLS